jgi:hypothetical protein
MRALYWLQRIRRYWADVRFLNNAPEALRGHSFERAPVTFLEAKLNGLPPKASNPGMKRIEKLLVLVFATVLVGTAFAAPTESELMKEARISKSQAEKTALAKIPNGAIKSGELEREHGKLVWSFDIGTNSTKNVTEVQVDAKSGKIISVKTETPVDQAREAAAEKESQK